MTTQFLASGGASSRRLAGADYRCAGRGRLFRERRRRRAIFRKRSPIDVLARSAQARNGTIEGWVGLLKGHGEVVPCAGARVYLLVRPVDLDSVRKKAALGSGGFNPRLAHLYVEYLMINPETQRRNAYAKARADARGRFEFRNLPSERWYYVIAQALGNVMVSWQVAVYLHPRERVQIVLTNTNAALPIYSEQEGPAEPSAPLPVWLRERGGRGKPL